MKRLVVFSGAGMSAESGLKTFRDSGGLWEEFNIEDVATPEAWQSNPALVLRFYNMRRKQVIEAQPNKAHEALVKLEEKFDVQIVTQNIDDLHERAGSTNVLHLHGEILKARPDNDSDRLYSIRTDLSIGDTCERGTQLRPHVVWFGEEVPELLPAAEIMRKAHIVLIIGTSLNVYPAAGLIHYAPKHASLYLVDPNEVNSPNVGRLRVIQAKASDAVPTLVDNLLSPQSVSRV